MKITILGLGRMGRPIARNLMEDGHTVTLYLRRLDQAMPEELAGARPAHSLPEAVAGAQVVVSVVPDDAAEEDLTFGPGGLLEQLGPGAVHLCMSSISPTASLRLAQAHQEAGQGYVAAPILGSPRGAADRQIWFIAGGPEVHVVRCLGMLEALGRGVTRIGARVDLAHGLKLGAQALSLAVIGGLAETLAYGEKIGYSPASYLRLLNLAQFKSPQADAWGALMVRHDHEASDQTVDQAVMGLDLLQAAAREQGLSLPLASHLRGQMAKAREEGLGALDVTALSMIHRRQAGLPGPWTGPPPPRGLPEPSAKSAAAGTQADPGAPAVAQVPPVVPVPAVAQPPAVAQVPPVAPAPAVVQAPAAPAPPGPPMPASSSARGGRARPHQPERRQAPETRRSQERKPGPSSPSPERSTAAVPEAVPVPVPAPPPPVPPAPSVPVPLAPSEPDANPFPAWTPPPAWTWTRQVPSRGAGVFTPANPTPAPARDEPPAPPAPVAASAAYQPTEPDPNLYYEEEGGAVWGYHDGQHHPTSWRRIEDAEFGVTEVTLVRVSRHRSLNPQAVREFETLFGGRSRVLLTDGQVLVLGREPTRKLKFILGV